MAVTSLPRILGANYKVTLTTGSGNISVSQHTEMDLDESPETAASDTSANWDREKVITKYGAKLTIKGLRGLNNCYSDLPRRGQRITDIELELVDEEGNSISGEDLPDLIRSPSNPEGYTNWAVVAKKGNTKDADNADFELELESGILNAIP